MKNNMKGEKPVIFQGLKIASADLAQIAIAIIKISVPRAMINHFSNIGNEKTGLLAVSLFNRQAIIAEIIIIGAMIVVLSNPNTK